MSTREQMIVKAGFVKVKEGSAPYDVFWRSPQGTIVSERLALEVVEDAQVELLSAEFPAGRRRLEDRKFFAGLAMRALIGRLDLKQVGREALVDDRAVKSVVHAAFAYADAMMAKMDEKP